MFKRFCVNKAMMMRTRRFAFASSMGLWAAWLLTPVAHAATAIIQAQLQPAVAPDVLMPVIIQGGGFGLAAYFVWWTTQPMTKAIDRCTDAITENTLVTREVRSVLDRRHPDDPWDARHDRDRRRGEA